MHDEAISRDRFEHEGRQFEMAIFGDDDNSPPWERSDGHGPVRYLDDSEPLRRRETVLCDLRRGRYVYDVSAAILQASREGWGLSPESLQRFAQRIGKKPTKAQIRMEAIREDMRFLREWCADDWCYVGVSVRILDSESEPIGDDYEHALWGVESNSADYLQEVAAGLADEILSERRAAWRAHLKETREVVYWQSRDVQTLGA